MTSAAPAQAERGSAVIEFVGMTALLLLPLAYLIASVGAVQAANLAADGAAREAVRAALSAPSSPLAATRAHQAAQVALADHGYLLDTPDSPEGEDDASARPSQPERPAHLELTCSDSPCLTPGSRVTASMVLEVPLPGMPSALRGWLPLSMPVRAEASGVVGRFEATR